MLTDTAEKARGLADLPPVMNDSLIALIGMVEADPRADKIDVGVGVFRDGAGNTPILKVIKEAEQRTCGSGKMTADPSRTQWDQFCGKEKP